MLAGALWPRLEDAGGVELLLAAGYRPTVWRNMAPPNFRSRLLLSGSPRLELFDPINYHGP